MENQSKNYQKELDEFFFRPEEEQHFFNISEEYDESEPLTPKPAPAPQSIAPAKRKKVLLEKLLSAFSKKKLAQKTEIFSLEFSRKQKNLRKKEALLKELLQNLQQGKKAA